MMIVTDNKTSQNQSHLLVADQSNQARQADVLCVEVEGGV
jgi:hypothetical protein